MAIINCPACASKVSADAATCPTCGHPLARTVAFSPSGGDRKTSLVAALFALLLGGLGAHKFYLGRPGQGVVYLLFCWTFIPGLLGVIEGVIYLTMAPADFDRKYNR